MRACWGMVPGNYEGLIAQIEPPAFGPETMAELQGLQNLDLKDLPPPVEECLLYMRTRLLSVPAELKPATLITEDVRLLRFLRAEQWDCAKAWAAYESFLAFRKEKGMDAHLATMVKANKDFFRSASGRDSHAGADEVLQQIHFHPLSEACEKPYPRLFTKPVPGGHQLLLDRHGNLLVCEAPGCADFEGIVALGEGYTQALLVHTELRVLILDELSRRRGFVVRTCSVLDMTGLKTGLMLPGGASKAETEGFKEWQKGTKALSKNYPDTTFRNYMLAVPAAWLVERLISSTAPARSKDKFRILSADADYKAALTVDVAAEELPTQLGGVIEWELAGTCHPAATDADADEEDGREGGEIGEKSRMSRARVKKKGLARLGQRFGHWVTNDHPDYVHMSPEAVQLRREERRATRDAEGAGDAAPWWAKCLKCLPCLAPANPPQREMV